jgi:hypothetical protein
MGLFVITSDSDLERALLLAGLVLPSTVAAEAEAEARRALFSNKEDLL